MFYEYQRYEIKYQLGDQYNHTRCGTILVMNILILILGITLQTLTIYRSSSFFKKILSQSGTVTFGMILVESLINTVVSFLLMLLTLVQTIMLCEVGGGEYCSNGVLFIFFLIPASIIWGILATLISKFLTMRDINFRNAGLLFSLLFLGVIILTSGLFYSIQQNEKIKTKEVERHKTLLSNENTFICIVHISRLKPYPLQLVSGYKIEGGILKYYKTSYSEGFLSESKEAGFVSGGKITLNKDFDYLANGVNDGCTNSKGELLSQVYGLTLTK